MCAFWQDTIPNIQLCKENITRILYLFEVIRLMSRKVCKQLNGNCRKREGGGEDEGEQMLYNWKNVNARGAKKGKQTHNKDKIQFN